MFSTTALVFCCSLLAAPDTGALGVKVERNVPVKMRDGVILRADVHRPNRGGPYPVLVMRTPYGKSRNFDRYVKAGYIVVSQDVRGRYASEGKWESFYRFKTHDAEDGYDTVEWAAKLPGSTGKVGTFGASYNGFLQWRLAPLGPPSLVAMSARSVPARLYHGEGPGTIRPGIRLGFWAGMAVDMRRRANRPGVHTAWEAQKLWRQESEKWVNFLPWLELPQDFFGHETDAAKYWLRNPHRDPLKLDEGCKDISVPNLDIVGWYDHANGDMLLFRTMVKEAKTKVARKGSRIVIGPWRHVTPKRRCGDIDFGPSAELDTGALIIRWFDYWLKGKPNGVDKDPPVRIFVMGDNKWRDEQHWPLRRTKAKTLFFTSGGHANTPSGDGKLVDKKLQSSGTDKYVYDPRNPVPSPYILTRAADQRRLAKRRDILVYQTQPLTERVEATGNPVVELYAASSAPDTDWLVRLIDVAPDGLAWNVSTGLVRARYRGGLDKPKLLKPDQVVKYSIRMNPTSNAFLPGHRIRLDITSSDFPNRDRHHNTAANQNADATLVTANQTIYHGGPRPTRIILPWVPNLETEQPYRTKPTLPTESLHQAAVDGEIDLAKSLISRGADPRATDEKGMTPLNYAARHGHKEVVQFLLAKGADVDAKDNAWGWTPLHEAAGKGHKAVVELLITKGGNIHVKDKYDWTPLHIAVVYGYEDVAECLVAKGTDVDAKDMEGCTILCYAASYGLRDVVELLLAHGADVKVKDENGRTPLHKAAEKGHSEVTELLLATGADLNAKDNSGSTPLHLADHRNVAGLLLAKGADVNEQDDEYGFTPLHYAARHGHRDVAELLLTKGADVDAKDKWGYTPLHVAAFRDRRDVVELLIAKGAKVNLKTALGQTPLELAEERRNSKEMLELLRKHGTKE